MKLLQDGRLDVVVDLEAPEAADEEQRPAIDRGQEGRVGQLHGGWGGRGPPVGVLPREDLEAVQDPGAVISHDSADGGDHDLLRRRRNDCLT